MTIACTLWALRVNSSPMEESLTVPHYHCTMVNGDEALQLRAEEAPVLGALTALAVALMFFEEDHITHTVSIISLVKHAHGVGLSK